MKNQSDSQTLNLTELFIYAGDYFFGVNSSNSSYTGDISSYEEQSEDFINQYVINLENIISKLKVKTKKSLLGFLRILFKIGLYLFQALTKKHTQNIEVTLKKSNTSYILKAVKNQEKAIIDNQASYKTIKLKNAPFSNSKSYRDENNAKSELAFLEFLAKHGIPRWEQGRLLIKHFHNLRSYIFFVYYQSKHILAKPIIRHY